MRFWRNLMRTHFLAAVLILAAGVLAVSSMWYDSAIRDEMPHIVAGYSYLTKGDYRVNPEHPPLIKELAALPLLLQNVYFPENDSAWKDHVNDQWDLGNKFLYKYGNDADKMLFTGRIMMVLVFLLGGWMLYRFTEKITKRRELALVALILFLFSPNLMAHGRFITTDMGATVFSLFALYAYYLYLEKPNWRSFTWAGIVFGLALLAKFSTFLLIPVFFFIAFIYGIGSYRKGKLSVTLKETGLEIAKAIGIMAIGGLLVGIWYTPHIWNMPAAVQHQLVNESIKDSDLGHLGFNTLLNYMTDVTVLRPYSQYLLGFLMVSSHTTGGHTTYFFGQIGTHWPDYFIFAYLLKEPLAAQILFYFTVLLLFIYAVGNLIKRVKEVKPKNSYWLRKNAVIIGYAFLAALVFGMASVNKLQLGIRYILPVFPFLYMLTAVMLGKFAKELDKKKRVGFYWTNIGILIVLLVWLVGSNVMVFPSYLPYFNELKGGPKEGWKYMVDSNVDWGQDLIRLKQLMDKNNIPLMKIDYFGGGDLDYYLGNRYEPWGFDKKPSSGWFAISASAIQWNTLNPPERGSYHWLTDNYEPVKFVGNSILVYHVTEK